MRRVWAFFAIILVVIVAVAVVSIGNINRAVAGSDWSQPYPFRHP